MRALDAFTIVLVVIAMWIVIALLGGRRALRRKEALLAVLFGCILTLVSLMVATDRHCGTLACTERGWPHVIFLEQRPGVDAGAERRIWTPGPGGAYVFANVAFYASFLLLTHAAAKRSLRD